MTVALVVHVGPAAKKLLVAVVGWKNWHPALLRYLLVMRSLECERMCEVWTMEVNAFVASCCTFTCPKKSTPNR